MALTAKSDLKVRRLKELFTPENIVEHYDRIIAALAYKLALDDINELAADVSGKEMDSEELGFQLQLVLKKIPAETKARIVGGALHRIRGEIPGLTRPSYGKGPEQATFWIEYARGQWKVSFYSDKFYNSATHKKFEANQSVEALDFLLKQLKKKAVVK